MATSKASHKLDIFRVLHAADTRQRNFYQSLSEEERKGFQPLVAMRWLSASPENPDHYAWMTNHYVNRNFWELRDHPELIWKLMAQVGRGKKCRHEWIAMPKRTQDNKVMAFLLSLHPGANDMELKLLLSLHDEDSIAELAKSTGMTDHEVKVIVDEYRKVNGKSETKRKGNA